MLVFPPWHMIMQAHMHTGSQVDMHAGTQASRHTCMQAHRHTGTPSCRHTACMHTSTGIQAHMAHWHTSIWAHMHMGTWASNHTCIQAHGHTYLQTCRLTVTQTLGHIHTHVHRHAGTYVPFHMYPKYACHICPLKYVFDIWPPHMFPPTNIQDMATTYDSPTSS